MKCLKKYKWIKLPRHQIPDAKGIMGVFLRLASRAAFRKGYNYYGFVPMDSFGTRLLRILTVPDCSERLLGTLFNHEERSYERGSFTYDAYVDGEYVLSFLDSNIWRLFHFFEAALDMSGEFRVVCFPEQQPLLKACFGDRIACAPVKMEEIEEALGIQAVNYL